MKIDNLLHKYDLENFDIDAETYLHVKGTMFNHKRNDSIQSPDMTKYHIMLMTADYGNLGDVAISWAMKYDIIESITEEEWLDCHHKIIDIPISAFTDDLDRTLAFLDDLTLDESCDFYIVGGGNIGNTYTILQDCRELLLLRYSDVPTKQFAQSIHFTDDRQGRMAFNRFKEICRNHNCLKIEARDESSFNQLTEFKKYNYVSIEPDVALRQSSYFQSALVETLINTPNYEQTLLLIKRNDIESVNNTYDIGNALSYCGFQNNQLIELSDTHLGSGLKMSIEERSMKLTELLCEILRYEWIVTDRLHGVILANIFNKRIIAVDNSTGKIRALFENVHNHKFLEEHLYLLMIRKMGLTHNVYGLSHLADDVKNKQLLSFDDCLDYFKYTT